nr:hypothetical protein [Tanacetum cinerariifolium]
DGDDEEESSKDDEEDDMDVEADEDEEEDEEHQAPTDSVVIASIAADQAPSMEETEPFETDESAATPPPHPAYQREVGYGITNSWDEIMETLQGAPVSTDTELGGYVRE